MKIPRHIYDQFAQAVHQADAAPIGEPYAAGFLVIPLSASAVTAGNALRKLADGGRALVEVLMVEPDEVPVCAHAFPVGPDARWPGRCMNCGKRQSDL